MTHRDLIARRLRSRGLRPADLPAFAEFAAARSPESDTHGFEEAEEALLHPRAVESRRAGFRLGRAAAHAALRRLGRDEAPILTGPGREPVWPAGVVGSISHASDVGVALVAPAGSSDGVGIDIEERRPAPELQEQVPRPEELSWLDDAPDEERHDQLLALFSAKETIFKAFYPRVGSFFGFEAASLVPTTGGFRAHLVADLHPDYPAHRTFDVRCEWIGDLVLAWLILPSGGAGAGHREIRN